MSASRRVWFHRARAAAWLVVGLVSFPFGWAGLIAATWIASVYANVVSDWTAAEAADDRSVVDRLDRIEARVTRRRRRQPGRDPTARAGRRARLRRRRRTSS